IHDYLRLLFARGGTPYCPNHPEHALEAQNVAQMVDTVMAMPQGSRLMILAPARTDRKGGHQELFEDLRAQGFVRVRVRTHGQDHQAGQSTAQNDSASPATPDAPRVYELE
ncbi:MAG: excinuclease ABC subunit UvrA, partial [Quisquiliibacterium sp.]